MTRWLWPSVAAVLGIVSTFLLVETRRLAELAGGLELEADRWRRAAAPPPPADALDFARAQLELASCNEQLAATRELLRARTAELERRARAAESLPGAQAMPEGVRNCLMGLHECLRAAGYLGARFLGARAVDADGLHDVELLDCDAEGLAVAFVQAGRMTATLDRSTACLRLRFFSGHRSIGGQRHALPADGFALEFHDVDGPAVERRLPFLVQAEGSYPVPAAPAGRAADDVDAATRQQWIRRFERLFTGAGTPHQWRLSRFRGMQDGWFLEGDLVASDARHMLVATAHCSRFAVEVQEATGIVSVLLQDGTLRQAGVESSIAGEGYRIVLPNVPKSKAIDIMLGMIIQR